MSAWLPPDLIYAELFEQVQSQHLFSDSKTFVDAVAKSDPVEILERYRTERDRQGFDLAGFVAEYFDMPERYIEQRGVREQIPVEDRINSLWDELTRESDKKTEYSSLIPLPNPFVVPGGRFREVYYWDSYFTMLGLMDADRIDLINDMVDNFAHLIDKIGFVPNGNRSYYCTRSQPPFFALMVELLAQARDDQDVLTRYLPQLIREYEFWMAGATDVNEETPAHRRVILVGEALLNRYWDDSAKPRQESYQEDVALVEMANRNATELYRDVRAGAESGWDFSSRWLADGSSMSTIQTTHVIPVDLNSIMHHFEMMLGRILESQGRSKEASMYVLRAGHRRRVLQSLFFDEESGLFVDLSLSDLRTTGRQSLATMYPLFFGVATPQQAASVARRVHSDFLLDGGWVTTLADTGQQWDYPNGWAPLQWVTYCGLENYGFQDEATAGAQRWVENNLAVYAERGCFLEKYNVESRGLEGVGGEYSVQHGFGWTNAVLIRLMSKLDMLRG